jgi:tetratricopeptide (TPR) repeat protein
VRADFLWPFSGQPHVHNAFLQHLPHGPFPSEVGDAYLNRLVEGEGPVEPALSNYLERDLSAIVDLDQLFRACIDRQKELDEETGYDLGRFIEQNFRSTKLFLSPARAGEQLLQKLATNLLQKLSAESKIALISPAVKAEILKCVELPIHPSVARYFGLEYGHSSQRYRQRDDELLTFEEYALRYVQFRWNAELAAGAHLAMRGEAARAVEKLGGALSKSPGSGLGLYSLGVALILLGRDDEAEEALARSLAVHPYQALASTLLGHLLMKNGASARAEEYLRRSLDIDPSSAETHYSMSHVKLHQGDVSAAIEAAQNSIRLDTQNPRSRIHLGNLFLREGRFVEAEDSLRSAIALDPKIAAASVGLAYTLVKQDRIAEAVGAAQRALEIDPNNQQMRGLLAKHAQPVKNSLG